LEPFLLNYAQNVVVLTSKAVIISKIINGVDCGRSFAGLADNFHQELATLKYGAKKFGACPLLPHMMPHMMQGFVYETMLRGN
jgi:hypothetical protein